MPKTQRNPLQTLNNVISETVENLDRFKKSQADFTRKRKLNAETALKITLNMQGNSLNAELLEAFPDIDDRVTASAYEQAKDKLSPELFEHIMREYNRTAENSKLYNGKYRLLAIDGSDFATPYNKNSSFVVPVPSGRPKKNGDPVKPFCQIHANLLYDIGNRTYQDCVLQPKTVSNERDAALEMLHRIDIKDPYIVIMDRGYDGFNMIENCNRLGNGYYVIRTKTGAGGIREIAALPDAECDVDMSFRVTTSGRYYEANRSSENIHLIKHIRTHHKATISKNTKDTRWDFGVFGNVKCRIVKFKINDASTGKEEWEVLITNLDRDEFPVSSMKSLYHKRWDIETSFRELKYALGGIHFHSKKDDFIKIELYAHFIMFNAVSRSISNVSAPQTNHIHPYAIDFKMACLVVRKYYRIDNAALPDEMYVEILAYINPVREGRKDKRNMRSKSAVWFVYRVA